MVRPAWEPPQGSEEPSPRPGRRLASASRSSTPGSPTLAIVFLPLLALVLVLLGGTASAKEKLIKAQPAQMAKTDQRGFNWDPNIQGVLNDGTSDCFDGAMSLKVNGGAFTPTKPPMQTTDGQEYVLSGAVGQIAITRRIRIDPVVGAARYVEVFENKSKRSVRVTAAVHSTLGSSAAGVMTNRSRAVMAGQLQKGETAIFAMHNGGSRPSVIFQLRGAHSKNVPVVTVSNNRQFNITWTLSIPAGRTTAILHSVAQRRWGSPPNAKAMEAELKPMLDAKWAKSLPTALRAVIANHSGATATDGSLTAPALAHEEVLALAKAYEVERGKNATVLIERDKPLVGMAEGSAVTVKTRMGEVSVPFKDVAIIRGGANVGRSMRLLLRDGEILSGSITAPSLLFKTKSGLDIPLDPAGIDVLILPKQTRDGVVDEGTDSFLTQLDGTKLALKKAEGLVLAAVSPWGDQDIDLDDVVRIRYTRDPLPGLWVLLRDGSRFPVAVRGDALPLVSRRFGPVQVVPGSIAAWSRHGVAAAVAKGEDGDDAGPVATHVHVVGGCYLTGTFVAKKLSIETVAGTTPVTLDQISKIVRNEDEEGSTPLFDFTMRSGETIQGRLSQHLLNFKTPRGQCRVPLMHLWGYRWYPSLEPAPKKPAAVPDAKDGEGKDAAGKNAAAAPSKKAKGSDAKKAGAPAPPKPVAPPKKGNA
jgi:hypothetical protein